jgi:acetyltransferase-like isoleucine patch superfamily enzyme
VAEPRILQAAVRDVSSGAGVTIVAPANIYECALADGVFVGPFCEIQRGVAIGERTRIQSHTFICEQVTIGSDCFIGHGVMFINDLLRGGPAGGDRTKWAPTTIGDGVSIGSNATILPVSVAARTVIGAGSVVTRDIVEPGTYVGNPARRIA